MRGLFEAQYFGLDNCATNLPRNTLNISPYISTNNLNPLPLFLFHRWLISLSGKRDIHNFSKEEVISQ